MWASATTRKICASGLLARFPNRTAQAAKWPTVLQTRSMFIQTETTPNGDSLKFKPGVTVMQDGGTHEFCSGRDAMRSPLALRLFGVEGVQSVLFGPDFIAVNKQGDAAWPHIKPHVFGAIMDHFSSGQELFREAPPQQVEPDVDETDSEVVAMIKELLDTRIRPAIQQDGGDVQFAGFSDGTVKLRLQGACRTCDSSTLTLKNGIENMLRHYIPEVERVEQVLDELDRINLDAFERTDG